MARFGSNGSSSLPRGRGGFISYFVLTKIVISYCKTPVLELKRYIYYFVLRKQSTIKQRARSFYECVINKARPSCVLARDDENQPCNSLSRHYNE